MLNTMLVEDNVPFRNILKSELLYRFPGTEVLEADSGETALIQAKDRSLDLVLMDVRLPGQNGFEITRKIKAIHPDTPVIILTSYNLAEYRDAARRCGANGFIGKDSLRWEEIGTSMECCQRAKLQGRPPVCVRLLNGDLSFPPD
jgi:DNA-binding NarL/FixJ family response regulator